MALDIRSFAETFFDPLLAAATDIDDLEAMIRELGWEVALTEAQATALATALSLPEHAEAISGALADLGSGPVDGSEVAALLEALGAILADLDKARSIDAGSLAALPAPLSDRGTFGAMVQALPEYLALTWLRDHAPAIYESLHFCGAVRETVLAPELPRHMALDWPALGAVLAGPGAAVAERYAWGAGFRHAELAQNLARLARAFGLGADLAAVRPELAAALLGGEAPTDATEVVVSAGQLARHLPAPVAAEVVLAPAAGGGGAVDRLAVCAVLGSAFTTSTELGGGWRIDLASSGAGASGLALAPDGAAPVAGLGDGALSAALAWQPETAALLFGSAGGARVEALRCDVEAGLAPSGAAAEARLHVALGDGASPGLRIVISPSDGDSFVAHLLGVAPLAVDAGLALDWSSGGGLTIEGGVGLEIVRALDRTVGPLSIDTLRLALFGGTAGASVEATVTGGIDLGLLAFVAEDVGLRLDVLRLAEGATGPFGPVGITLGFRPPSGFGVVIRAGDLVSGGGYLEVDAEAGRYAGAAEIRFVALGLSAVGIIETRLPGRPDGWSMFLSVYSEFPPLQLGFGFVLIGVGGLVGINRTLDYDALQSRLLAGAMDSIMFPENPVENAPAIIDDLSAVFPAAEGQFLFGAMLKLGWGTPALIEVDLGLVLEMPDPIRIVLLGQAAVVLPTDELAVIELHMDVAGVADLTAGTLALDAVLRDSHIAETITLGGAMAMRAEFAERPKMLISVGGFHSGFTAPPGFPDLPPIAARIPVGPLAEVSLSGFVAVTSNTFQMGGRVEVWVELSGFTAEGHLGAEALIQFSPFGFDLSVDFGVTVRAGKITLMGVEVNGRLLGPSPVEVIGEATFEILEFRKSLDLHLTTEGRKARPKASEPVAELVLAALRAEGALAAASEAAAATLVSGPVALREDAAGLDPAASLTLAQKIAPLGVELSRFGGADITGPHMVAIDRVTINGATQATTPTSDWFAPAQYFVMRDAERLKAPSFEEMTAGVRVAPHAETRGAESRVEDSYEQIVLDRSLQPGRRQTSRSARRAAPAVLEAASRSRRSRG